MNEELSNSGISWVTHPNKLFSIGPKNNKNPPKQMNLQRNANGTNAERIDIQNGFHKKTGAVPKKIADTNNKSQKIPNGNPKEHADTRNELQEKPNRISDENGDGKDIVEKKPNECPDIETEMEKTTGISENGSDGKIIVPNKSKKGFKKRHDGKNDAQKNTNNSHKGNDDKNNRSSKPNETSEETADKKNEVQKKVNEELTNLLMHKLKSNTELFEMVKKLANIVEDNRNTGILKKKMINDIITSVETIKHEHDMEALTLWATDFKDHPWRETLRPFLVDEYQIECHYVLGVGATAFVHCGTFLKNHIGRFVAIKKPKLGFDEFLFKEAAIMSQFDHNNIIKLIAVCEIEPGIALELMDLGCLTSALKKHTFTDSNLLNVIKDVASGMEYLHSKDYVHRDLACRNIMVNSDKQCKIGDFGHCVYVGYTEGEYLKPIHPFAAMDSENIPLEVCEFGYFSRASDVWAMGILIYDMFISSFEKTMIYIHRRNIIAFKNGHERLEKPKRCPENIWIFTMKKMLNVKKTKRTTFSIIREKCDNMIRENKSDFF